MGLKCYSSNPSRKCLFLLFNETKLTSIHSTWFCLETVLIPSKAWIVTTSYLPLFGEPLVKHLWKVLIMRTYTPLPGSELIQSEDSLVSKVWSARRVFKPLFGIWAFFNPFFTKLTVIQLPWSDPTSSYSTGAHSFCYRAVLTEGGWDAIQTPICERCLCTTQKVCSCFFSSSPLCNPNYRQGF